MQCANIKSAADAKHMSELLEALTFLEKEKNISRETLLEAIRQSLLQACKNNYGKSEITNVVVNIDPDTCDF